MDTKLESDVRRALAMYRTRANQLAEDAGHAGQMDDNGAGIMHCIADAYESGLNRHIPGWIQSYLDIERANEEKDKREYERLKKKFGNQ